MSELKLTLLYTKHVFHYALSPLKLCCIGTEWEESVQQLHFYIFSLRNCQPRNLPFGIGITSMHEQCFFLLLKAKKKQFFSQATVRCNFSEQWYKAQVPVTAIIIYIICVANTPFSMQIQNAER